MSEHYGQPGRQACSREAEASLEALLVEGLDSGDDLVVDREFWKDLRAEAERLLQKAPRE